MACCDNQITPSRAYFIEEAVNGRLSLFHQAPGNRPRLFFSQTLNLFWNLAVPLDPRNSHSVSDHTFEMSSS